MLPKAEAIIHNELIEGLKDLQKKAHTLAANKDFPEPYRLRMVFVDTMLRYAIVGHK